MTTTEIDQITPRVPVATRVGQGTAVEQSRAVAEVQAAIVVAQQCPRNVSRAIAEMRESCRRKELADRAFFRYSRGGAPITGGSVHLARELARVWGNFQYGLTELRRDDDYGQSEMLAFAWDVQTNTRNSSTIINPHRLYTGGRDLTELRDIYENNANVGARRVREAIFAVLPAWFVEEAKDICLKTITDGGGVPLPQRIANAIEVFGNLGVTVPQLEAKLGLPSEKWTDQDVAQLRVIRQSLLRGEISKDEEFPAGRVSGADIIAQPVTAPAAPAPSPPAADAQAPQQDAPPPSAPADDAAPPAEPAPAGPGPGQGSVSKEQTDQIWALFRDRYKFTRDDKAQMRQACENLAGRKLVGGTIGNLSADEAATILDYLASEVPDRAALIALLAGEGLSGKTGETQ